VSTFAAYGADRLTNLRRRLAGGGIANTRLEYNFNFRNRPDRVVVSQGDCATASCETSFALAYDDWGSRATETPSSGQGSGSPSRQFTYGPDGRLRTIRVATPGAPAADCSPTQWNQVDTDVGYDQRGVLAFRRRRLGSTTQQVVRYSRTPTSEVGYTLQAEGPTGAARVTYKYLYLAGERVVAVRETWDGSTRTDRKYLFLHADRNGAPIAAFVADHPEGEATQQWTADRDAWGWTTISSAFASSEMPFEFPGQLRLDGTEFTRLVSGPTGCLAQIVQPAIVSNGCRDYDPVAGIYLTRDPISRAGSSWAMSSTNRNLYAYAGFNPTDRFDYWGLETPSGFDDGGRMFLSFIPIIGPGLGMRDAIVQGDWAMAVMNASFLVLDIASMGSAAMARAAGTGAVRAVLSAEGRYVARGVALAAARNELAAARRSCEAATEDGLAGSATWGRAETLPDHFERHGADVGARTAEEYAESASELLTRSQAEGLPTKIDSSGTIRVYDPNTNTFGAFNPDGTTRTIFSPSRGRAYFDAQPGVSPSTL
jgi:RHS repeat-associated protein